jgi:hypothetical protein
MHKEVTVSIRIGHAKMARANYREFLSDVPSMYAVDGLPSGEHASIAQFGTTWKILRIVDDVPSTWTGNYSTPQEAAAALSIAVSGVPPEDSRGPQPHDGIARQGEDGLWNVYQMTFGGTLQLLAGPFDKRDAIRTLQDLVPVEVGDRWVIDAWGVGHTLN